MNLIVYTVNTVEYTVNILEYCDITNKLNQGVAHSNVNAVFAQVVDERGLPGWCPTYKLQC